MKKVFLTFVITGFLFFFGAPLKAQVSLDINFNIGSQPVWGPVGYDQVQYYYLPDIDSYYYVPEHRFYYYDKGRWTYSSSLPSRYSHFDLFKSYKVVVNEHEPWKQHKKYHKKYASFKGRHDQKLIRDSRDSKYYVNKDHPEHGKWKKEKKHDNRNDKSHGKHKK